MSTSTPAEELSTTDNPETPIFPVETEIYLLPNGQVIIADMPAELDALAAILGSPSADDVPIRARPALL